MPAKPMSKGQYAKNYQTKVTQRWVSSKKGIWAARDASSPYAGRSWPANYMNGIKQHPVDSMNAVPRQLWGVKRKVWVMWSALWDRLIKKATNPKKAQSIAGRALTMAEQAKMLKNAKKK